MKKSEFVYVHERDAVRHCHFPCAAYVLDRTGKMSVDAGTENRPALSDIFPALSISCQTLGNGSTERLCSVSTL